MRGRLHPEGGARHARPECSPHALVHRWAARRCGGGARPQCSPHAPGRAPPDDGGAGARHVRPQCSLHSPGHHARAPPAGRGQGTRHARPQCSLHVLGHHTAGATPGGGAGSNAVGPCLKNVQSPSLGLWPPFRGARRHARPRPGGQQWEVGSRPAPLAPKTPYQSPMDGLVLYTQKPPVQARKCLGRGLFFFGPGVIHPQSPNGYFVFFSARE